MGVQQHHIAPARSPGRLRPGLRAGGYGLRSGKRRHADTRDERVVPGLPRLPPVLRQPPAIIPRLPAGSRRTTDITPLQVFVVAGSALLPVSGDAGRVTRVAFVAKYRVAYLRGD